MPRHTPSLFRHGHPISVIERITNDGRFGYLQLKDNPPGDTGILFLHGVLVNAWSLSAIAADPAMFPRIPIFMLHWPDECPYGNYLPALGEHPRGEPLHETAVQDLTTADFADVAVEFMDRVGLRRALIVGHSFGGTVAETVALRHPDRVIGLGLISTVCRWSDLPWGYRVLNALKNPLSDNMLERIIRIFKRPFLYGGRPQDYFMIRLAEHHLFDFHPAGPFNNYTDQDWELLSEQALAHDAEHVRRQLIAMEKHDVCEQLGKLNVPATVIHGNADHLIPLKAGDALFHALPAADRIVIPSEGHFIPAIKWEVCAKAIADLAAECRI